MGNEFVKKLAPYIGSLAYAVALAAPSYAADLDERMAVNNCAVSAPNGKIEGAGGSIHSGE